MLELSLYLMALDDDGDRDKLNILYERYLPLMYKVARKFSNHYGNEDDIVHDAVLKIIEHLDQIHLDKDAATKCYICTIVKNKALDQWRKENRVSVSDITEIEIESQRDEDSPVDTVLNSEGYEQLVRYISELSDTYKDVCRLKFICGLSEKAIAESLDISVKNVSVRTARGRKMLIKRIKEAQNEQK